MVGTQNWVALSGIYLWAIVFSILGAFGILSLASDIMPFERHIASAIELWQDLTRPVIEAAFGWVFEMFGLEFPWWLKDYLIMCIVATGMLARTYLKVNGNFRDALDGFREQFWRNVVFIVFWPYPFYVGLRKIFIEKHPLDRKGFLIYFETIVWAVIVIGVNYILILGGMPVA